MFMSTNYVPDTVPFLELHNPVSVLIKHKVQKGKWEANHSDDGAHQVTCWSDAPVAVGSAASPLV
jgi:hypothetical protein